MCTPHCVDLAVVRPCRCPCRPCRCEGRGAELICEGTSSMCAWSALCSSRAECRVLRARDSRVLRVLTRMPGVLRCEVTLSRVVRIVTMLQPRHCQNQPALRRGTRGRGPPVYERVCAGLLAHEGTRVLPCSTVLCVMRECRATACARSAATPWVGSCCAGPCARRCVT